MATGEGSGDDYTERGTAMSLTQSSWFDPPSAPRSRFKYPHMMESSSDEPLSRCYAWYPASDDNYLWIRARSHVASR